MLRIGLIGTGTVGGGVIQILEQKIAEYKEKLGVELELACICAKSEEVAPYKAKGYKVSTYDQLGGTANPLTDSILDRIIHNAYTIDIRGSDPSKDISMREFYGLDKKLSR